MRGVWVEPQRAVAHAQAGCLLGDVDRETQVHGLATVLGFVSADRHRRAHAGRRVRLPDAALGLDLGQRGRHGRRHRRGPAGARERRGERRSVLGAARRRRQLRRRHRHRLRALPGRSGDRRRRRGLARQRGAEGAGAVPDAGRAGAARADAGRADAHGAAGAVASEGHARKADRRVAGLPQRHTRGRREGGRAHQGVRQARRRRAGAPAVRADADRCSTRRSPRAGATTGRASTCRASSRRCARR